jgi:ribulose-phosphate 3-epimerase
MPIICPTVTAFTIEQYREQSDLLKTFAKRVHLDLMDGVFAPTNSPPLSELWPLDNVIVDLHVMYQRPQDHIEEMLALKPNLIVFHREADVDHEAFARQLQKAGVKAGIALLQKTGINTTEHILPTFEHLLVFSGNLGYHGGSTAELQLLEKATRALEIKPTLEIGWDGGINADNACALVHGGITVLNTGGYIHKAPVPQDAFMSLQALVNKA